MYGGKDVHIQIQFISFRLNGLSSVLRRASMCPFPFLTRNSIGLCHSLLFVVTVVVATNWDPSEVHGPRSGPYIHPGSGSFPCWDRTPRKRVHRPSGVLVCPLLLLHVSRTLVPFCCQDPGVLLQFPSLRGVTCPSSTPSNLWSGVSDLAGTG